ncbi:MAG: hypothetical protein ACQCN4_06265 [Candidatus Bathyarchaeia archaeon]
MTFNGIAKAFTDDNMIKFVDIASHNENLRKITESIREDFVGQKNLLTKAASIHDLWKRSTIYPKALLERNSLFRGHSTKFPAVLVSEDFDDIEFDSSVRKRHFDDYYVLNLVRLHHSGFSTYSLYKSIDFIFETFENEQAKATESINGFIKDWYALMTADWIDSAIMGALFQGDDLEFYLTSEIMVGRTKEKEFYVIPEDFLEKDVTLTYRCVTIPINEVTNIIKNSKRHALNKEFLLRLRDSAVEEVFLHAT